MATVGNRQSITILSKQCSSRHFIEVSSLNSIIISMASKVSGKNCCNLNPKNTYHKKKTSFTKSTNTLSFLTWPRFPGPFIATPHSPRKLVLRQVITKLIRLLLSIPLLNPSATAVGWATERFQASKYSHHHHHHHHHHHPKKFCWRRKDQTFWPI